MYIFIFIHMLFLSWPSLSLKKKTLFTRDIIPQNPDLLLQLRAYTLIFKWDSWWKKNPYFIYAIYIVKIYQIDKAKYRIKPNIICLTYIITTAMKVDININTSITASLIGQAVILMMMFVEIFRTCVIVFICKVIMYLTSQWPINFQYQKSFHLYW